MTGSLPLRRGVKFKEPSRYYEPGQDDKHDHVRDRPRPTPSTAS